LGRSEGKNLGRDGEKENVQELKKRHTSKHVTPKKKR